ncbi:hypothetical protein AUP68_06727 [Ilyonectria robusta]
MAPIKGPQTQTQQATQESSLAKSTDRHNFPPGFWDELSKVFLTPRALREIDRRQNTHPRLLFTPPEAYPTDLARFARNGGPDLKHLQGYPEPKPLAEDMCSHYPSSKLKKFKLAGEDPPLRTSSGYDACFEKHLRDHGIYMEGGSYEEDYPEDDDFEDEYSEDDALVPEPANLDEIRRIILAPRASISSQTQKSVFSKFKRQNGAATETTVMTRVIPIIEGNGNFFNCQDARLTNLFSMTNGGTVALQPDYFDGARMRAIHEKVQNDLSTVIISTHDENIPVAANFFLEAKSTKGNPLVGKRQACIGGANGSRAMQALASYGEAELVYDNNAYAFSATYQAGDGLLQLYAHHTAPPTKTDGKPNYHMTLLKTFVMRENLEMYIQGITAFTNLRHLAKRYRNRFIRMANSRASNAERVAAKESLGTATEMKQPDELDCREDVEAQEAHDTTNTDDAVSPAENADRGSPTHFNSLDDEQQGRSPARPCKRKLTPDSSKQLNRVSKVRNCRARGLLSCGPASAVEPLP